MPIEDCHLEHSCPDKERCQRTFCLVLKKAIDLSHRSIEGQDLVAVVCHIHDEILAHDGQADEAEICSARGRPY